MKSYRASAQDPCSHPHRGRLPSDAGSGRRDLADNCGGGSLGDRRGRRRRQVTGSAQLDAIVAAQNPNPGGTIVYYRIEIERPASRKLLGIDVGSTYVRAVSLRTSYRRVAIEAMNEVPRSRRPRWPR